MTEMTANVILLCFNLFFSWKAASFFLLLKKISIVMFCLFKKLYLPLHKLIIIRTINLAGKQLWSLVNEFYISKNVNLTEFKVLRISYIRY